MLAFFTVVSTALPLHDVRDRAAANLTGFTRAAIHRGVEHEVTGLAFGVRKVTQSAAAQIKRALQDGLNRRMQARRPC